MEKYRDLGLKLTPQRIAILGYLTENLTHPSAEEIYKAVSKEFPTMSFATVYNTLDALKAIGFLQELSIDPDKKRYECNRTPHHHFICVECKDIFDIQREFQLDLSESITKDFELLGSRVEFYGICRKCKKPK